jgi:thiol peroxidase
MKTILAAVCLVALTACHTHQPIPPKERVGEVTLKGNPVTLLGEPVEVGDAAPDFVAVKQDMTEAKLSDYAGKTVVISVVPSVDTKVCAMQTRAFNGKAAALGDNVVILTISMDLPMAQKRFCAAEGIDQVVTLSDYRHWDFANKYGQRIKENGLLARAIYVVGPDGVIKHKQIVPELTTEPDYDAAIKAAGQATS